MFMNLCLKNLQWISNGIEITGDVQISNGIITEIGNNLQPRSKTHIFDLRNYFLYPGLINSHDHLEMNLYPKLGTPPYNNYVDWAKDIYKPDESPLKEIERINIKDRLLWGGIKNLISGVTSVVHHNPWHRTMGKSDFPVKVLRNISWAHSLAFEKKVSGSFPKKGIPYIIHAGEGIDEFAFSEVIKLKTLNFLQENTVLIHAIALKDQDIDFLSNQKTSIVWCPASNLYMFKQTAAIKKLRGKLRLAIGSDATLTGSATLLDEIKAAANTNLATPEELFRMVTSSAAQIFHLPEPSIDVGQPADLFVAPIKHKNYFENLLHIRPCDIVVVLIDGKIKLLDVDIINGQKSLKHIIKIQGVGKCIDLDLPSAMKRIEKKVSASILEKNPLWNLIHY
jgi:cytosine/adenosine deaminase-related metal-dependent hydrolase